MKNHTSVHLLQAALRQVLGDHVHQAGSYVDEYKGRFDFYHYEAVTPEQLAEVQAIVNRKILEAIPVVTEELPIEEAKKRGAMMLFSEKYGDVVRVVSASEFSVEFCGGTHVDNTLRLGLFKITSENSVANGIRRIESTTDLGVLELLEKYEAALSAAAKALKIPSPDALTERCAAITAEVKALEKENKELSEKLAASQTGDIMSGAVEIKGVRVATVRVSGVAKDALRTLGDNAKDKYPDSVVLFVDTTDGKATFLAICGKDALAKGANAGKIVREVAAVTGGKGGGRPDSAMAGAGDISLVDKAAEAFAGIVEGMIG
jgi:alanyl-tRNA synthetase